MSKTVQSGKELSIETSGRRQDLSSLRELRNSKKLVYQEWRDKWKKKKNYRDEIRKIEGRDCSIRPCGPLKDFGF